MKKLLFLISLAFVINCENGFAQEIKYYVTFYAYAAELIEGLTPGHVIIAFGKEDDFQMISISEGAWGFYPIMNNKIKKKLLLSEEKTGVVNSDDKTLLRNNIIEARFSKQVSAQEYNSAYSLITKWNLNRNYHILNSNCVHFAHEIAKLVNLKVPINVDSMLPENFLIKLVNLN